MPVSSEEAHLSPLAVILLVPKPRRQLTNPPSFSHVCELPPEPLLTPSDSLATNPASDGLPCSPVPVSKVSGRGEGGGCIETIFSLTEGLFHLFSGEVWDYFLDLCASN